MDSLEAFVQEHGEAASSAQFDITKLDAIPSFAQDIIKKNPDLDSVFLNSGIQRGLDFSKPESLDLSSVETELTTNYTS